VFLELPGGSVIDHLERVVAAWLWDWIRGSADSGNAMEVHSDCCRSAACPTLQIALPGPLTRL
jgi:hypothetical protein